LRGRPIQAPLLGPSTGVNLAAEAPKLVALKLHADWCGTCRKMGPAFEDAKGRLDGKAVLFVVLDRTNRSTRSEAEMLASALGLGGVYDADKGTGKVLVVDAKTKKLVATLSADLDGKAMAKELEALL
jgi:thiol-disulfide isomerase/thioredoxin